MEVSLNNNPAHLEYIVERALLLHCPTECVSQVEEVVQLFFGEHVHLQGVVSSKTRDGAQPNGVQRGRLPWEVGLEVAGVRRGGTQSISRVACHKQKGTCNEKGVD